MDIQATAVPFSEILEELARRTGMKVVYDAARPQAVITVRLEKLSVVEAVTRLMEGLGLNYAFMRDRTGMRIETLVLSASAASAKADRGAVAAAAASTPFALAAPQFANSGGIPQSQEELAPPDGEMPVAVPEPEAETPSGPVMATAPANDAGSGQGTGRGPMGRGPGPAGPGRFGHGMGPPFISGPPGSPPAQGTGAAEPIPPIARPTPEP